MSWMREAVVVGGGVIGCSIAFHLARLGMRNVLLLEKGSLAGEASGRSGAVVRMHYTNEHEARLALASLPWFEDWAGRVGGDCGFQATGFLQMVGSKDRDRLRNNVKMLRRLGVTTELVEGAEIRRLQSWLRVTDGDLAAYEPGSGYADPVATTRSFAQAAGRLGAEVREGVAVTALGTRGGRVRTVETTEGPVATPVVVLANGGWAPRLLRPLGIELDLQTTRVQVAFFRRPAQMQRGPVGHFAVIDRANGFYARPHGDDATLVGLSAFHRPLDLDGHLGDNDADFLALALRQLTSRAPEYAGAELLRGHAGPIDMSPDGAAVLGPVTDAEGLYLAVGMSGTGFKKSPAIGACMAELIVQGEAHTAPLHPFRLSRFAEEDVIAGASYSLPSHAVEVREIGAMRGRAVVH